ncbi:uncharacterized protein LOC116800406 [Drosophila sechellia]|uniref:Uncharacterized protein n=1 Tax=Drosophila simulans TaxID=7240 RepID=A0A0J9RGC0_DROSI|nr:uncharacterized protein LOC27207184 [Drosophila simulans]XP_032571068.1 uncharacterized protein LOC116800406 [Drosophila sechellia]KMY94966.1 uncharacterized protein Dsimw501_GD27334 [Drosophila simulans]
MLLLWFILHLIGLIQGRSVGGGFGNLDDEFFMPQPDPTIFAYNQTDKGSSPWDNTWN